MICRECGGRLALFHPQCDCERRVLPLREAAGGVVVSSDGQKVLLRRPTPTPGYDTGWSHAKGGVDAGESLEAAALREIREELGAQVFLTQRLPGEWEGEYSVTTYFLGRFELLFPPDEETAEVRWFPWADAAVAISAGSSWKAASRDLSVLELARAASESWRTAAPAPRLAYGQRVRVRQGVQGEGYRFQVAALVGQGSDLRVYGVGFGPIPARDVEVVP